MTKASTTVVIPAWGSHVAFLPEAIASVRAQEPAPCVVVIDNAAVPPIDAPEADVVVRLDERVTIGEARNRGLDATTTTNVVFWDADDVMLPGTIQALSAALDGDPGAVVALGSIVEDDGHAHGWPRFWLWPLARIQPLWLFLHATSALFSATGAAVIRTEALRAAGGFPHVDAGDDWVAAMSLACRGRVVTCDRTCRVYRRHPAEVSRAWDGHDLRAGAREVRARLRTDPAAPLLLRRALPIVVVGQAVVSGVLRPVRRRLVPRIHEQ